MEKDLNELMEKINLCVKLLREDRQDWRGWRMMYDKRKEERRAPRRYGRQ